MLVSTELMEKELSLKKRDEVYIEIASRNGFSEVCTLSSINQIAIDMGCIEAPIVFSEIDTEIEPAFF